MGDENLLKRKKPVLAAFLNPDPNIFEIGIDEVGRGPMFGRVYAAAVILPKDDSALECSEIFYGIDIDFDSALSDLFNRLINKYNTESEIETH